MTKALKEHGLACELNLVSDAAGGPHCHCSACIMFQSADQQRWECEHGPSHAWCAARTGMLDAMLNMMHA